MFLLLFIIIGNINFYEAKNLGGKCCSLIWKYLSDPISILESTAYVPPLGPNKGKNIRKAPNSKMVKLGNFFQQVWRGMEKGEINPS